MTSPIAKTPVALIILDGYGSGSPGPYNAISHARKPVIDSITSTMAQTTIATSGLAVGLPEGQMGNSEVGHMTIGAGRVIYQSFTRINKAISDGDFFTNPAYVNAIDAAVSSGRAVHVLGLLSEGGVHSHQEHIFAALELAAQRGAKQLYLHAFLDGRDTPPRSAAPSLEQAEAVFARLGQGRIASVVGRFFALDRDKRWDRVQAAYDLLTGAGAPYSAASAADALAAAYERGEDDEFVAATRVGESAPIQAGDAVLFMNFRPDRARQITAALTDPGFDGFARAHQPTPLHFVMTTEYAPDMTLPCAFPPEDLRNTLGEVLAAHGKTQLRIAETEKYAHVTFFLNGGQEALFEGEERILVPSPKVKTYDLQPEMSAPEVTRKLVEAIDSGRFDVIVCNYANCDQVGHSGNFDAAVKAVEAVDSSLGEVLAALQRAGGHALISADHGNVELMYDEASGQPHTQHTTLPVPLYYVGNLRAKLRDGGSLADLAPTVLTLAGVPVPNEMTGSNLLELQ